MKPPRRGDPWYVVYVDDPTEQHHGWPWKQVASCQDRDTLDAVLRLYKPQEAFWAEVTKP